MSPFLVITSPPPKLFDGKSNGGVLSLGGAFKRIDGVKKHLESESQRTRFHSHETAPYHVVRGSICADKTVDLPLVQGATLTSPYLYSTVPYSFPAIFRFFDGSFENAAICWFEDCAIPGLPSNGETSRYIADQNFRPRFWKGRTCSPVNFHVLRKGNGGDSKSNFVLNPFILELDPAGNEIHTTPLEQEHEGPAPDLLRILHPEGIHAIFPLLQDTRHDLRWRFLRHLWKILPKNRLSDWPAAFRLFFAPWSDDQQPTPPCPVSPEPFFVLDLLGGTFVIEGHGTGKPEYDWIPPDPKPSNLHWIATSFYRRWKRLPDTRDQHHLHWTPGNQPAVPRGTPARSGVSLSSPWTIPVNPDENLHEILARISADQLAEVFSQLIGDLDHTWQKYHERNGYVRDGRLSVPALIDALARAALPQSPVQVTFPPKAEEFGQPSKYDMRDSRFRGASAWVRELIQGASACAAHAGSPRIHRFFDTEAPRRRGYGWWHDWAQWLSTRPHDLCYPRTCTLLRLGDPLTPLDFGTLGECHIDERHSASVVSKPAEPARFNREPVFW